MGCTGKAAFTTAAEARTLAERGRHHGGLRVYHCQHCDFFHLTSMTKQVHKRLTRSRA